MLKARAVRLAKTTTACLILSAVIITLMIVIPGTVMCVMLIAIALSASAIGVDSLLNSECSLYVGVVINFATLFLLSHLRVCRQIVTGAIKRIDDSVGQPGGK
jgi:hypothetical protein